MATKFQLKLIDQIIVLADEIIANAFFEPKQSFAKIIGAKSPNCTECRVGSKSMDSFITEKGQNLNTYIEYLNLSSQYRDYNYSKQARKRLYGNAAKNKQEDLAALVDLIGDKNYQV